MDESEINPNAHERSMNALIQGWEELRPLLDLVVSNIKRGKPPTFDQMQLVSTLSRDVNTELSYLIPHSKNPEQPIEPEEPYIPWQQRVINEFLAEFVEEEKLNPTILTGEEQREVRFSYHTSERVYQSDYFSGKIPLELWELRRAELVDFLKEKLQDNPWEYFTDMETTDSDLIESELEIR